MPHSWQMVQQSLSLGDIKDTVEATVSRETANRVIEKAGRKEWIHLQSNVKQDSSRRFRFRNLIPFGEWLETRKSFLWGQVLCDQIQCQPHWGALLSANPAAVC